MNVMVFLLISLIAHAIPIPYTPGMLRINRLIRWLPTRLIWGTAAWAFICLLGGMTLPWALITLIMSFALQMLIVGGFRPGTIEEIIEGARMPMMCIGLLVIIIMPVFSGLIGWTSDVANAQYVDDMIIQSNATLFESPIPDTRVRLVTQEYASFVARQQFASIGSNIEIAAAHITTRNDRLVWVCVVVSTNVLSENFIKGLIVVDANDPSMIEVLTDVQIPVGEGLFWDKNIQFGNYLNDMTNAYEYAYPTWDPIGQLVYVQTRTQLGWDFVERPLGPTLYFQNGTIVSFDTIALTPHWVTQAYSEEWLERDINRWGGYRRGDSFDLFAGGFLWAIPPSNDRLEMTEDTRYILNPDTGHVEAIIAVHPPGSTSLALSGMIRATKDGIFYHDLSQEGYASGEAATNEVIKAFPNVVTGDYYGAMPLLYPVQTGVSTYRYVWYCPIYWIDGYYDSDLEEYYITDIRLHALGMADAIDVTNSFTVERAGSLTGAALVKAVREGYINAIGGQVIVDPLDEVTLTANVTSISSYVEDGDTHFVLGTTNSTFEYIVGTKSWMNLTDWYELINLQIGDNFTAHLEHVGEEYRIVAIVKN
ncbi:MAG: hypothetical protein P1Q69_02620 [Candidatus Thorarchaeota archaeon]|nr:hypothetical protein [Candidatus Thorarchaeota archaeon]